MGKKSPAERLERLKVRRRAERLRAKARKGGATPAELAELEAMPKARIGRPPKDEPPEETAAQDDAVSPEPAEQAETPPKVEPPEPPPHVEVLPRGGDWRAKYRSMAGREGVCVEVATLYCNGLAKASAYIAASGARPIFDLDDIRRVIFPAAVLTADKLLPADFEMSPEVELVATSGALLGQAALVRFRGARKAASSAPPRTDPKAATHATPTTLTVVPAPQPTAATPERPTEQAAPRPEPFIVRPDTLI